MIQAAWSYLNSKPKDPKVIKTVEIIKNSINSVNLMIGTFDIYKKSLFMIKTNCQ